MSERYTIKTTPDITPRENLPLSYNTGDGVECVRNPACQFAEIEGEQSDNHVRCKIADDGARIAVIKHIYPSTIPERCSNGFVIRES